MGVRAGQSAGASQVAVQLRHELEGEGEAGAGPARLYLSIADNGAGIAPADRRKPQSCGLRGMRERAAALGGTMNLSDAEGGGTIVAIAIPLASPGAEPAPAD